MAAHNGINVELMARHPVLVVPSVVVEGECLSHRDCQIYSVVGTIGVVCIVERDTPCAWFHIISVLTTCAEWLAEALLDGTYYRVGKVRSTVRARVWP